jgi:hypothetical protein
MYFPMPADMVLPEAASHMRHSLPEVVPAAIAAAAAAAAAAATAAALLSSGGRPVLDAQQGCFAELSFAAMHQALKTNLWCSCGPEVVANTSLR